MSDDERVLRSFVGEDEELRGIWSVTKVKQSKGQLPPPGGERPIAVTDQRLLWYTSELDEVPVADVENVELEYVERQAAPPMVLGGGLLLVLGIFASIGAFIADVGDTLVVALPALTGLGVFLATRIIASMTGREGEMWAGHRLRLWIDGDPLSIWGDDEDTMAAVRAAITGDAGPTEEFEDEVADAIQDGPDDGAPNDGPVDDGPPADGSPTDGSLADDAPAEDTSSSQG